LCNVCLQVIKRLKKVLLEPYGLSVRAVNDNGNKTSAGRWRLSGSTTAGERTLMTGCREFPTKTLALFLADTAADGCFCKDEQQQAGLAAAAQQLETWLRAAGKWEDS
jgi:hypothetical protein